MGDLEPGAIAAAVDAKSKSAKVKPPSELDLKKEERLMLKEQRMNVPKAAAASGPPVVPGPDPSQLLDKINAYKERFPRLKSRNPKITAKSSVDEIVDELHFIELQLGSSKDGSMGTMMFVTTMAGVETITRDYFNPLGLRLNGLGQVAKDNVAEFQEVIDELMIKYGAGFYMQPETRLVLAVGALVMTVHSANSGDSRIGDTLKKMNSAAKVPAGSEGM